MPLFLAILISYGFGSIPSAYLYGKYTKGIDIRDHGSGNVGATNVFRVLGKGPGTIVLIIDIVKGIIPVYLVADLFGLQETWYKIILAIVTVAGHNWTVFLKFKGGKGIATSLGALIGLTIKIAAVRLVVLGTVVIWIGCFLITGIVSFSSIIATIFLPILMVLTDQEFAITALGVIMCLFVVFRHKANIGRLLSGKEPRVNLPFHKKRSS